MSTHHQRRSGDVGSKESAVKKLCLTLSDTEQEKLNALIHSETSGTKAAEGPHSVESRYLGRW